MFACFMLHIECKGLVTTSVAKFCASQRDLLDDRSSTIYLVHD